MIIPVYARVSLNDITVHNIVIWFHGTRLQKIQKKLKAFLKVLRPLHCFCVCHTTEAAPDTCKGWAGTSTNPLKVRGLHKNTPFDLSWHPKVTYIEISSYSIRAILPMLARRQLLIYLLVDKDQLNIDDESNLSHWDRSIFEMDGKERWMYKPTSVSIVLKMEVDLWVCSIYFSAQTPVSYMAVVASTVNHVWGGWCKSQICTLF